LGYGGGVIHKNDLVGTGHTEIVPDHFLDQVGIGMGRIEQLRPVGEPRPLALELRKLGAFLRLDPAIIAQASTPFSPTIAAPRK
jgi:hypothetical protein